MIDKDDFKAYDADFWNAIAKEEERQQNKYERLLETQFPRLLWQLKGLSWTAVKYEGYLDVVTMVELTQQTWQNLQPLNAKEIFGAKFANVQPHQEAKPIVLLTP